LEYKSLAYWSTFFVQTVQAAQAVQTVRSVAVEPEQDDLTEQTAFSASFLERVDFSGLGPIKFRLI
jgi:hypothetical protein